MTAVSPRGMAWNENLGRYTLWSFPYLRRLLVRWPAGLHLERHAALILLPTMEILLIGWLL